MKKLVSTLLTLIMSITVVATAVGCGPSEGDPVEAGATVITMYAYNFEEYQTTWYETQKKAFNSIMDDGLQLEVKYFDKNAYASALQVARENDQEPDIFWCAYGNLNNLVVKYDYAVDLQDYMPQECFDDLVDNLKAAVTYNGEIIAYPQYAEPSMMFFYRKSIFEQAGVTEVPTTWSELLEVCAKVKPVLNKGQYTLGIPTQTAIAWATVGLQINTTGGYAVTDDWMTNRVNENDAGWRALTGLFWDINEKEYAPAAPLTDEYDFILSALCEGALAMTMGYAPGIATCARTYPEDSEDIGYAIMPTWDESETGQAGVTAVNGGWNYLISKSSDEEHRKGAAKVIEFLCCDNVERTASLFEVSAYSRSSPNKSVREYIAANANPEYAERQALVDYVSSRAVKPASYAWDITHATGQMFSKMFNYNTQDPKDKEAMVTKAITEARQAIDKIISSNTYQGNPDYVK